MSCPVSRCRVQDFAKIASFARIQYFICSTFGILCNSLLLWLSKYLSLTKNNYNFSFLVGKGCYLRGVTLMFFLIMRILRTLLFALPLVALVACGNKPAEAAGCDKKCDKTEQCGEDAACDKKCDKAQECEGDCGKNCSKDAVVENIMSRRSIRKYKEQAVDREVLKEIFLCGINAPNGQNKQSWEVRVVDKPELQNEIKEVMSAAGGERAAGCFFNAPVWVFIARDTAYDFSAYDCGLLAENVMLSAHAMDLGTVCLGSPVRFILESPKKDDALSKLGFSDGYELCLCIAIGYPDEAPAAKPRDIKKVRFID